LSYLSLRNVRDCAGHFHVAGSTAVNLISLESRPVACRTLRSRDLQGMQTRACPDVLSSSRDGDGSNSNGGGTEGAVANLDLLLLTAAHAAAKASATLLAPLLPARRLCTNAAASGMAVSTAASPGGCSSCPSRPPPPHTDADALGERRIRRRRGRLGPPHRARCSALDGSRKGGPTDRSAVGARTTAPAPPPRAASGGAVEAAPGESR
ncbi:unnamed protein product, partial [Scytosiphon promiscuus]